ncbi:MAG: diguanylate cyclase [Terriglobia bacterium]
MELASQGAFLQKFLASLAGVEVSQRDGVIHWQGILRRRKELAERLERPVSLRTAAVDYFGTGMLLRNPILLEYQELKRLRQDAATDPLTALYNRRLFREALGKELSRSQRYSYPLALLLLDLRNFKAANDKYGHPVGDEVLLCVARACTATVRGSDYPCRIGGDEFAILLPQSDNKSAQALAERISQKFCQSALALAPGVGLGIDYGVAAYPEDGDRAPALFEMADRRLYHYKRREKGMTEEEPEAENLEKAEEVAPPLPSPLVKPQPVASAPAERSVQAAGEGNEKRRYGRISLEGTGAYGVLRNGVGPKVVRLVDLSFGGFSFLTDETTPVPESFHARLHAPLLPVADYRSHRVYAQALAQGLVRVGCRFVT